MSTKARGFVLDERTGRPAQGIVVRALVEYGDGRRQSAGTLTSDAAGYVSFDLSDALRDGSPARIVVAPVADGRAAITVSPDGEAPVALDPFVIRVPDGACAGCNGGGASAAGAAVGGLPSVQSPDERDWELSPGSFTADRPIVLDDGACQVVVPTEGRKFATSTYRFFQVVRRSAAMLRDDDPGLREDVAQLAMLREVTRPRVGAAPAALHSGEASGTALPPPPPGVPAGVQGVAIDASAAVEVGQVLAFSQTWWPLGHSMGKVVYSLPLAPCESVDIAVIDWSRSDEAVRTDRVTSKENLSHVQRRDRTIDDIVDAALTERQGGWSVQAGLGGAMRGSASATIPIEAVDLNLSAGHGLTAGFGVGSAESWGDRDLTGFSLQQLHDTIVQTTGLVRQLNSTVVVQSSQQERNYLETRTVTNHNHCHALTVQYHEVLQHSRIKTRYEGRRWALLIPYRLLDFDWRTALRYRAILERVLVDADLKDCFDAIVRLRHCPAAYELPGPAPAPGTGAPKPGEHPAGPVAPAPTVKRYELTLMTGNRNTWGRIWVHVGLRDGSWKLLYFKERKQDGGAELWANQDFVVDVTSGEAVGVPADQIERVRVGWYEADGGDQWLFKGIRVRYERSDQPGLQPAALVDEQQLPYLVDFNDSWGQVKDWTTNTRPVPRTEPTPTPQPEEPEPEPEPAAPAYTRAGDECCEQRLLLHLQANVGLYSRACWLFQDPTERVMMLNAHFAGADGIASAIDPIPVAVAGNYVAYVFNGVPAPEPVRPQQDLEPRSTIVSVPTRGLFAETHLSHCSACEERDVKRFWNWGEAPCPERPPQITGVTPGPRGEPATVTPASLPTPVVNVLNAPDAPDPTGLAAAFTLLGTPDVFRDMSTKAEVSKLLDGLVSGAVTLAQAKEMAAKAKDKLDAAGAGGGAKGTQTRSAPNESSASGQVDKLDAIQYAADKGLISDKQKQDAAAGVLGGDPLPSGAGPGTGGSGAAGTLKGSSPSAALPLIAAFRARTGAGAWKLSRSEVADRLEQLVKDPNLVRQQKLNVCGPAAFVRVWAERDPVAFAQFTIDLFERGRARIGTDDVVPDSDLLGQDYATLKTTYPPEPAAGALVPQMPPPTDWMVLSALRDDENALFDFEGTPEETVSGITPPGEIVDWIEAAGTHTTVSDDTNFWFTKGLAHAQALAPGSGTDVILLINAKMLGVPTPFVYTFAPNHYIELMAPIVVTGTDVEVQYWSWGRLFSRVIPRAEFEKHYYGAITAVR